MQEFKNKILTDKVSLLNTLLAIKLEGKSIVGYGAPAKATTFLHYYGIGADVLDFIVDDSPYKDGKYMPGNHIPILASADLFDRKPDYVLILAWNFAESIIEKLHQNGYRGKCIVPFT